VVVGGCDAVTEMEIQQGLLSSADASKHCLCFMRHVTNLEDHVANRRAQKYIDTVRVNGKTEVSVCQLITTTG